MIKSIKAKEILNSRGNPTVKVKLKTTDGVFRASVPSGTSEGKYESVEKIASIAVRNVNQIIAAELKNKDPREQNEIDELLIKLDGTENKKKLGANAILAVSIAVCRAGAKASQLPLYKYLKEKIRGGRTSADFLKSGLPKPSILVIEGGLHGTGGLEIQEFMVVPEGRSFKESFEKGKKIYQNLKKILKKNFGKQGIEIGYEQSFTPPISDPKEALDFIMEAAGSSKMKIGLDCAASNLKKEKYNIDFYQGLVKKYPIIFLEDPFSEEDWKSFRKITDKLGKKITIIGDDLLATNIERIKKAKNKRACNGVVIKPDQIGTVTETLEAVKLAKAYNWKIMVSHRSGETKDDFIADLAVGVGADFIKSGAPVIKERLAKYNRLLKIEKELV